MNVNVSLHGKHEVSQVTQNFRTVVYVHRTWSLTLWPSLTATEEINISDYPSLACCSCMVQMLYNSLTVEVMEVKWEYMQTPWETVCLVKQQTWPVLVTLSAIAALREEAAWMQAHTERGCSSLNLEQCSLFWRSHSELLWKNGGKDHWALLHTGFISPCSLALSSAGTEL